MQDVPLSRIDAFRAGLLACAEEEAPELCARIDQTGRLSQEDREEILALARQYLARFLNGGTREG